MIKAIETRYKGYNFRSRLEARWAVFFDALGIKWEYEKEGYIVGSNGTPYLPDFYLPDSRTWVEVKGAANLLDYQLMADAVDWNSGLPGNRNSLGTHRGLLLLGPLPFVSETALSLPMHPILQHYKGGYVRSVIFSKDYIFELCRLPESLFDSTWGVMPSCEDEWITSISEFFEGERRCNFQVEDRCYVDPVMRAYTLARSARFEHGQKGGQQ